MDQDNQYCGQNINVPQTNFIPKSQDWNSMDFLDGLKRKDILCSDSFLIEKRDFFFHATFTEFDAENLCRHLDTLGYDFSPEFKTFEKSWRKDEWNHYIGFRYIYSIMFDQEIANVAKLIESRPSDFSRLENYFKDEFFITLLIAFDEILTTKSYASEFDLYSSFGHSAFLNWIKEVTRDEAYHFHNAMEVIRIRHFNRIDEIPDLLESFVKWDLQKNEYTGTFVLDHDFYSPEFLKHGASIIKNYFSRL